MKSVSIHQPCYLPYLGIIYKIWRSDIFVYLDDVQYSNGYVFEWNRIKTPQGECRLKIPLEKKFGQLLTEVKPKDFLGWKEKHLKVVEMNYKRAPYFVELFPLFSDVIYQKYDNLAELNIAMTEMFLEFFGLNEHNKRLRSSEMNISSQSETRVIEIVKKLGGNVYISGTGAASYQNESHFASAGIELIYSDYHPLEYRQQWGCFLPNMSVLDFAMNEGHDVERLFRRVRGE